MDALTDGKPKRGRGMAQKSLDLIDACRGILEEIQPTSVRSVCYQLFTRRLIPNMSRSETAKVSRLLVTARETGAIPWSHIVDETRAAERVNGWSAMATRMSIFDRVAKYSGAPDPTLSCGRGQNLMSNLKH